MPEMTAVDAIGLYRQISDLEIEIWIDGGWSVDALLGEQTRSHEDLDLVDLQFDIPRLRAFLEDNRFHDVERDDTSAWNFVLGDEQGRLVDVHAVVFDGFGNGLYGPAERGVMYPAGSLTGVGSIAGQIVNCISPTFLVEFHTGYPPRSHDLHDVSALCARFNIPLPDAYRALIGS